MKLRQRLLAVAKAQASSASKMMKSADAMFESALENKEVAQSQLDSSTKEVNEAENFVKDVEKRLEVIDVDDSNANINNNLEGGESNKKRRRISLSPRRNSSNDDDANDVSESIINDISANEARAREVSIKTTTTIRDSFNFSTYWRIDVDDGGIFPFLWTPSRYEIIRCVDTSRPLKHGWTSVMEDLYLHLR